MPCYICDKPMDEPKLDHRDMKLAPCAECEGVIQDCLDGLARRDGKDDDDFYVYLEPEEREFDEFFQLGRKDFY